MTAATGTNTGKARRDEAQEALTLPLEGPAPDAEKPLETAPEAPSENETKPAETAVANEAREASEAAPAVSNRKRIEEQLEALKRREAELRRELAVADHPELEEAIRSLEGHAYAVARVEAKIAQGFSKSEERRRESLEKKLSALREKRAELDTQIQEVEAELATLTDRARLFEGERLKALEQLMATLSTHDAALTAAGLEATQLVPEIARWLPEIKDLAEKLASSRTAS